MRELIQLTKIGLLNSFNLQGLNIKHILKDRKRASKYIAYLVLIVFSLVVYVGYIKLISSYTDSFMALNQHTFTVAMLYNVISMLIFILGIPYIMAYFYFSRDTDMLLSLPIKPTNIVLSKFLILVLFEYILVFLFMIPALAYSGVAMGAGITYYIVGLLVMLLTPIAPLALAGILIILLSRVTNLGSKKNLLRGIFLFLLTIGLIGFQMMMQKYAMESVGDNFMMTIFTDDKSLLGLLGKINPLAQWVGHAITTNMSLDSMVQLLYFIIASMCMYLLFMLVANKVYLGSIIGGNEVVSKKKALSEEDFNKVIGKGNPPYMAIFKTDMITMMKTPIYMFNCLAVVIIVPIIFAIPLLSGLQLSGPDPAMLLNLYKSNADLANFILAGVVMVIGAMTPIASTTFSREGKYFWISRIIPVRPGDQLLGRGLSALLAQVLLGIIFAIILIVSIPVPIMAYVCLLLGIVGSIPNILAGMLIDVEKPLLDWTNPQRAVKQNMNAIFGMLAGSLITVGLGGITYLLMRFSINGIFIMVIDLAIIILLIAILYRKLSQRIEIRFRDINA